MSDLFVITSDPQTLASCTSEEELDRRLHEFRNVRPLRVRQFRKNGWEDITNHFDHILRRPTLPDLD